MATIFGNAFQNIAERRTEAGRATPLFDFARFRQSQGLPTPLFPGLEPDTGRSSVDFSRAFQAAGGGKPSGPVFDTLASLNESLPIAASAGLANLQSEEETRRRNEIARTNAISTLSGSSERIQALLDNQEALNFRVITPEQEQASLQQIAQQGATGQDQAISSAAGRGVLLSGPTLQNVASIRAQTSAQGVNLRSTNAGINLEARNRIEFALNQELNRIDDEIARIQSDVNYIPSDFLPFAQLGTAADIFNTQTDRLDQQAGFTTQDLFNAILSLPGTGIPETVAGLFTGGSNN